MANPRPPKNTFDPSYIRALSELVYRARLEQSCPGDTARMIAKDEDQGEKLRNRAAYYDALTRVYLSVLGIRPTRPNDAPALPSVPAIDHLEEIEGAPV